MVDWNAPIDRRIFLGAALVGSIVLFAYQVKSTHPARPRAPRAAQQTSTQPRKAVAPEPLPPEPQDIANLGSSDQATQFRAARNLVDRAMTPELIAAVRNARPASRYGTGYLHCLQARLPGPEGFENALTLPAHLDWPGVDDAEEALCLLDVLIERAGEDPDRVHDVLGHYVISMDGRVHNRAVEAFRIWPAKELPPSLEQAIYHGASFEQRKAFEAVIAAGALHNFPKVLDDAIAMDYLGLKQHALGYLAHVDDHHGAQMLARVLVRNPRDYDVVRAERERQTRLHDGFLAIAEIALDESWTGDERATALELLSDARDPKLIPMLTPLTRSPDAALRTYAAAAISQISRNIR